MAKEVKAFEDYNGRLFRQRKDAVASDFALRVQKAWKSLPDFEGKGDEVATAKYLIAFPYARGLLREALAALEAELVEEEREDVAG